MKRRFTVAFGVALFAWTTAAFTQQYGWEPQISGTNNCLEAVTFVDANHGWAVGGNKGMLWQK